MHGINFDFACAFLFFNNARLDNRIVKIDVHYKLMEHEPVRFNEMRRYFGNAADKTLNQTLKELERDGLINRKMYPEIPPKVENTLTERGHSLMKVLNQLCTLGTENRPVK